MSLPFRNLLTSGGEERAKNIPIIHCEYCVIRSIFAVEYYKSTRRWGHSGPLRKGWLHQGRVGREGGKRRALQAEACSEVPKNVLLSMEWLWMFITFYFFTKFSIFNALDKKLCWIMSRTLTLLLPLLNGCCIFLVEFLTYI